MADAKAGHDKYVKRDTLCRGLQIIFVVVIVIMIISGNEACRLDYKNY